MTVSFSLKGGPLLPFYIPCLPSADTVWAGLLLKESVLMALTGLAWDMGERCQEASLLAVHVHRLPSHPLLSLPACYRARSHHWERKCSRLPIGLFS